MKRTLSIAFAGFLLTGIAGFSQSTQDTKAAQDSKTDKSTTATPDRPVSNVPEDAERLTTGQITKIDAKKKILTVVEAPLNSPSSSSQATNNTSRSSGGMGGGGMGGGRRRGGVGYPGGSRPTSSSQPKGKEFKVTVTDQTAIKDKVTTIGFDLLRIGDRISIQGLPKGKGTDLEATQITVSQ